MAKQKSNKISKVGKTIKLSIGKTKKIEKGFRLTIDESRDDYLSKELNKYKGIRVSYD